MQNILTTKSGTHISPEGKFLTPEIATDVVALLECNDYYLTHPSQKPKMEIAEYIESQGFRVPKRYKNLEEALASGKDFIMRSEHPQDYDGVSGLFESYIFHASQREVTHEEVLEEQGEILDLERVKEYCEHTGKNYEEFTKQSSFEYWEYIEGENLTVVRDEVVKGRYHIFVNDGGGSDYICYDSGNAIQGNISKNIGVGNIEKLIQQYEQVSSLSRFDVLQCPNIELQLGDDGNIYFLQYKRGHQKNLDNWVLDKELDEGEIKADFVRGSTEVRGEVFPMKFYGGLPFLIPGNVQTLKDYNLLFNTKIPACLDIGEGNMDLSYHGFVSQISQSGIYIYLSGHTFMDHRFSKLLTVLQVLEGSKLSMLKSLGKPLEEEFFRNYTLNIAVESDGKMAIIKILDSYDSLMKQALELGYSQEKIKIAMGEI